MGLKLQQRCPTKVRCFCRLAGSGSTAMCMEKSLVSRHQEQRFKRDRLPYDRPAWESTQSGTLTAELLWWAQCLASATLVWAPLLPCPLAFRGADSHNPTLVRSGVHAFVLGTRKTHHSICPNNQKNTACVDCMWTSETRSNSVTCTGLQDHPEAQNCTQTY